MGGQVLSGGAIGILVATLFWWGNNTPHLVSVFPDGVTLVVLAVSLVAAIHLEFRRSGTRDRGGSFRAGLTIAGTAGLVLGTAVIAMGVMRFTAPFPSLLASGFVGAIASALAIGVAASALLERSIRRPV